MDFTGLVASVTPSYEVAADHDFDIVIAHRGNPLGLWMTVHSIVADLEGSPYKYGFSIVDNGDEQNEDLLRMVKWLGAAGLMTDYIHHKEPLAPPTARQFGTERCKGKYIFFFDNHCVPMKGYFKRALHTMRSGTIAVLHSTTVYNMGEPPQYEYDLTLEQNFWATEHRMKKQNMDAYPVLIGGHGGFVVRRDVWEAVHGYGRIGLFRGWGGEESYFDLKCWLLGHQVYLDPQLIHYHHGSRQRSYDRHYSADYWRNLLMVAYIIGGEPWSEKVYMNCKAALPNMKELYLSASLQGEEERLSLEASRVTTLDELLRSRTWHLS